MADIVVTAASVVLSSGNTDAGHAAGETLTAGQAVYLHTDNKYYLAQADSGTAADRKCHGITLNGAASGQPVSVQTSGVINPGGTVTVGTIYVTSGTAGGIAPHGDLATGDYVSIIGVGLTASTIQLILNNSGVAVP